MAKNGGFKSIKHIFAHQYFSALSVTINKYDKSYHVLKKTNMITSTVFIKYDEF